MTRVDKPYVLRRIAAVRKVVADEIAANTDRKNLFSRGLATEGYAGGYLQALDDVAGALQHGAPSDHHGYWRRARDLMAVRPSSTRKQTSEPEPAR